MKEELCLCPWSVVLCCGGFVCLVGWLVESIQWKMGRVQAERERERERGRVQSKPTCFLTDPKKQSKRETKVHSLFCHTRVGEYALLCAFHLICQTKVVHFAVLLCCSLWKPTSAINWTSPFFDWFGDSHEHQSRWVSTHTLGFVHYWAPTPLLFFSHL